MSYYAACNSLIYVIVVIICRFYLDHYADPNITSSVSLGCALASSYIHPIQFEICSASGFMCTVKSTSKGAKGRAL